MWVERVIIIEGRLGVHFHVRDQLTTGAVVQAPPQALASTGNNGKVKETGCKKQKGREGAGVPRRNREEEAKGNEGIPSGRKAGGTFRESVSLDPCCLSLPHLLPRQRTTTAKGLLSTDAKEEGADDHAAADSSEAVESSTAPPKQKKAFNVWDYTGDEHMRVYKKNYTEKEIEEQNEAARKRTLQERKRVRDRVST